jgi:hypothetical protein
VPRPAQAQTIDGLSCPTPATSVAAGGALPTGPGTFQLSTGAYTVNTNRTLSAGTTCYIGAGAGATTILLATTLPGDSPGFTVTGSAGLGFKGLTIDGQGESRAVDVSSPGAALVADSAVFTHCKAKPAGDTTTNGAAVAVTAGASATFTGCSLDFNEVSDANGGNGNGGAIFASGSGTRLTVVDVSVAWC